MGLKRRTFLQKAGLGLATLGVSEILLSLLGDKSLAVPVLDRYFQALAQPAGRKLALLVGINQYPHSAALGGCVTDVELQRELLIHRFGFKSSDILTLTDSQASRENIETAFVEHLTQQAKAGDIVVFHFSGYGSRVKMGQESATDDPVRLQNSLVPVDGILATKEAPIANDLLEETLVLLLRSLATERVTTILDTSHTNASSVLQGNLRVRSCPNPPAEAPSPGELAFQEQIRLRSSSLVEKLKSSESPNQMPGIVLAAAGPSQLATERQWNGFSAGLFTYALTQHLWQAVGATTVQISLSRAAGTVNQLVGQEQQPRLMHQKNQQSPLLAYYLPPDPTIGADGVVTAVEDNGKAAQLWLAGLPATVLDYYGSNSILSLYPFKTVTEELNVSKLNVESSEANLQPSSIQPSNLQPSTPEKPQLQIRSKEGLTARARIVGINGADNYQLQVGQLVREAVRLLPRNVGLTIALDVGLERIERVDATSAFATIPSVSTVVNAGEQPADYLFGKVPIAQTAAPASANLPANLASTRPEGIDSSIKTGGYGLFYLGREPIRNTSGEVGEAVKSAVNRLTPKLQTLLAAKLLRLTANEGSSRLGIRASLEMVSPEQTVVMQRETLRTSQPLKALADKKTADLMAHVGEGSIPTLPIGSHIQYRLENYSDRPLYFMLLGLDSSGGAIAFYKIQSFQDAVEQDRKPPLKNAVIAPGETLTLPQSLVSSSWGVPGPVGLVEIQLICSQAPFTEAIKALEAVRRPKGEGELIGDLFNPLQVSRAVLQDLHNASAVPPESIGMAPDIYALDVNAWTTLSFIYQVV
jgi:hypothetical protein